MSGVALLFERSGSERARRGEIDVVPATGRATQSARALTGWLFVAPWRCGT